MTMLMPPKKPVLACQICPEQSRHVDISLNSLGKVARRVDIVTPLARPVLYLEPQSYTLTRPGCLLPSWL